MVNIFQRLTFVYRLNSRPLDGTTTLWASLHQNNKILRELACVKYFFSKSYSLKKVKICSATVLEYIRICIVSRRVSWYLSDRQIVAITHPYELYCMSHRFFFCFFMLHFQNLPVKNMKVTREVHFLPVSHTNANQNPQTLSPIFFLQVPPNDAPGWRSIYTEILWRSWHL